MGGFLVKILSRSLDILVIEKVVAFDFLSVPFLSFDISKIDPPFVFDRMSVIDF